MKLKANGRAWLNIAHASEQQAGEDLLIAQRTVFDPWCNLLKQATARGGLNEPYDGFDLRSQPDDVWSGGSLGSGNRRQRVEDPEVAEGDGSSTA